MLTIIVLFVVIFLLFRIVQRMYFYLINPRSLSFGFRFFPSQKMKLFIESKKLKLSEHSFISSRDGINICYKLLGKGKKMILLANGVGTNFNMWLPVFQCLYSLYPPCFDDITIVAPAYRGLFGTQLADITMDNCIEDMKELMTHLKLKSFDTIIGWSMGAQLAISFCAQSPKVTKKLFLLNPSTGKTLHTALQPIVPLPHVVGRILSKTIKKLISLVLPVCDTYIWDVLRRFAVSDSFFYLLTISAFLGGFPPEQPSYFHDYVRDLFASRERTKNLLNLIVALDSPCPPGSTNLKHVTIIASGIPDIMTGVYHSNLLAKQMTYSKHVAFTMGSHFLLIEWPLEIAKLILELINK